MCALKDKISRILFSSVHIHLKFVIFIWFFSSLTLPIFAHEFIFVVFTMHGYTIFKKYIYEWPKHVFNWFSCFHIIYDFHHILCRTNRQDGVGSSDLYCTLTQCGRPRALRWTNKWSVKGATTVVVLRWRWDKRGEKYQVAYISRIYGS